MAGDKVKPVSPAYSGVEPVKKEDHLVLYLTAQQEKEVTGSTG
jgi:hypothetical protein